MMGKFKLFAPQDEEGSYEPKFKTDIEPNELLSSKYRGNYEVDDTLSVCTTKNTPLKIALKDLGKEGAIDQRQAVHPTILQIMGAKNIEFDEDNVVTEERCNPMMLCVSIAAAVAVSATLGAFLALQSF